MAEMEGSPDPGIHGRPSQFELMQKECDIGSLVEITITESALYSEKGLGKANGYFASDAKRFRPQPGRSFVGYVKEYEVIKLSSYYAEKIYLSMGWDANDKCPAANVMGEERILSFNADVVDSFRILKRKTI